MKWLRVTRRQLVWTAVLIALSVGVVYLLKCITFCDWVGHADLEITYVVWDSTTGQPIPNARILVDAERGGLCDPCGEKQIVLVTGPDGAVRKTARNCMCFGAGDIFSSTWATHVPPWIYHVEATDYQPSEKTDLWPVRHLVKRPSGIDNVAHLEVSVRLIRKQQHP
jgi:hypothetical protein